MVPSARPEPSVLMPTPEEEVVSIVRGQGKQLVFLIQAKGKDDKIFWAKALVDTGAQANLIKKGLVANLAKPCKRPLRLVTANGDVLPGGDTEVDLMVHFTEGGVDVGPGKERCGGPKDAFTRRRL